MSNCAKIVVLFGVFFVVACGDIDETDDAVHGWDVLPESDVTEVPSVLVDEASGLMWQTRPPENWILWNDAYAYCENLELGGYSDWHLPTITELRTLIVGCPGTVTGGGCLVEAACGQECYSGDCDGCGVFQGPGPNGCFMDEKWGNSCAYHWSSSTYIGGSMFSPTTLAWYVQFNMAWIWSGNVNDNHMVARCVR